MNAAGASLRKTRRTIKRGTGSISPLTVFHRLALPLSSSRRIATKIPSLTTKWNIDTVISFLRHMFCFLHTVIMQHGFLGRWLGEQEKQQDVEVFAGRSPSLPHHDPKRGKSTSQGSPRLWFTMTDFHRIYGPGREAARGTSFSSSPFAFSLLRVHP